MYLKSLTLPRKGMVIFLPLYQRYSGFAFAVRGRRLPLTWYAVFSRGMHAWFFSLCWLFPAGAISYGF